MPVMTAALNVSGGGAGLRPPGPTEMLDRALSLLRSGPVSRVGFGFTASLPLVSVCLALYYLEVIEGVRSLRSVFALLLVAAFVFRASVLSRLARSLVAELRPGLPLLPPGTRRAELAKLCATASVIGFGVWAWLWPLAWLAQFSPFAILALVPLLAVRGGLAPSWLARVRCAPESGMQAFGLAVDDAAGTRSSLVFVELMLLGGLFGTFLNLFALTALLLLLSHSVLGLDVAFVSAFLSTDNEFVAYGLFALCWMLFDPLRAAVAACVFADARGRKDGADLHAAVDALLAAALPKERAGLRPARTTHTAASAIVLCLMSALPGVARAEPNAAPADEHAADPSEPSAERRADTEVRVALERILKRREFDEFEPKGARTFETWLQQLWDKFFAERAEEREQEHALRVDLPDVPPWLVMSVIIALLVVGAGYITWEARDDKPAPAAATPSQPPRLSERPASQLLSDARALAAADDFAGALRALYAATLATLDRARLIQFDPARTNGFYLRALQRGALRDAFGAFTRIFDRTWYGREVCTREDYEAGLALAEQIYNAPEARGPRDSLPVRKT